MRRFQLAKIAVLLPLSACEGGELPDTYRYMEVPEARLASAEARDRGRGLYLEHCALCHGERGDGRGRRRNLSSRPRDFTDHRWRDDTSPLEVYHAVREGVHGTAMPAWKVLDDGQTWDLVAFVLSLTDSD